MTKSGTESFAGTNNDLKQKRDRNKHSLIIKTSAF